MPDTKAERLARMSRDISLLQREAKKSGLLTLAFLLDMARLELALSRGVARMTKKRTIVPARRR
jgi:hypothetical protein